MLLVGELSECVVTHVKEPVCNGHVDVFSSLRVLSSNCAWEMFVMCSLKQKVKL